MAASYSWPATLPARPLTDYSEDKNLNILITPMDAGPAKMRRRSLLPDTLRVSYILTDTQVSTLETFVYTTLSGIARFNYTHPRTGVVEEVRIVPQGEAMYQIGYESKDLYRVTLTLQVLP